ncbi:hypothetical protein KY284_013492 [Solanum tuberosum]|nr:hypothetical protein KY284_013492 [Solanum tuberosum]
MVGVPMLCLEIVEVHAPDRVMRQFGRPQHVPAISSWGTNHHVHDQHGRLGPEVLEMLDKYFRDWGKPALEVDVPLCFVHSTGTSIVMSRGLFKLHSLALQWQRDTASASHGEEVS